MYILLADDHKIVRFGLELLIKKQFPNAQIDEAVDGNQAIRLIKENKYDIVVLDIHMPESATLQYVRFLLNIKEDLNIIIMSYLPEEVFAIHYLKTGAKGYIHKKADDNTIIKAIETVLRGGRYMSPTIKQEVEELVLTGKSFNPFMQLSEREIEVLDYLLQGLSISEIASKINLQHTTVSTYKTRLFEKLNSSNIIIINELAKIYNFNTSHK